MNFATLKTDHVKVKSVNYFIFKIAIVQITHTRERDRVNLLEV